MLGLLAALLLLGDPAAIEGVQEKCKPAILCVRVLRERDRAEFRVRTYRKAELTVTFELALENAAGPGGRHTGVYSGNREVRAFTLRRIDPRAAWRWRWSYEFAWGTPRARHDDRYVYALPFTPGTRHRVTQGWDGAFTHNGNARYAVDFQMPEGTPVLAAREGLVVHVQDQYSEGGADPSFRGRSNKVKVRHGDGTIGEYDHFRHRGVVVRPGQRVARGALLGHSGSTGYTRGPHLHFEVHRRIDAHERETLPARFRTSDEPRAVPVKGREYAAP